MSGVFAACRFWATVWLIKLILLSVAAFVVLPFCLIFQAWLTLWCRSVKMRKRSLRHFSRQILKNLSPRVHSSIIEIQETVHVMGTKLSVRALKVPCSNSTRKSAGHVETMLLLHGTAADSLVMAELFDDLSDRYHLLAMDIPGFGPLCHPNAISEGSSEDVMKFYACVIEAFLVSQLHARERVYIFAHSFGAFVAVHFVSSYPSRVSRLVLASPAGLLPTLGTKGAMYAYIFKQSITSLLRRSGFVGFWAMSLILHVLDASAHSHYWMHVLSSSRQWGDKVLAGLIVFNWTGAYWKEPALHHIGQLAYRGIPCLIVHGSRDDIMPPHQGDMIRILFGIPNERISGVGHSPLHGSAAKELVRRLNNFASQYERCLPMPWEFKLSLDKRKHVTPFDRHMAGQVISTLYESLLQQQCTNRWRVRVPPIVRDDIMIVCEASTRLQWHEKDA